MNIAICEDNVSDSETLTAYIESYCQRHRYHAEITAFESGEELLTAFSPGLFDLIFLDIFLTGISGMDTARKIRETDRDCLLVFVTVSEGYTMDGFLVNAAGYVVKPLGHERMDATLHMCRQQFEKNSRTIEISMYGGSMAVPVADLIYAEVYGKESVFHMKKGDFTARLPLDEIEAKLGGKPFLRCHRSYIVNMNHVADLRDEDFLMRNGDAVPIRKNGRREIRMAMAAFIAGTPIAHMVEVLR